MQDPGRFLTLEDVRARVALSRSEIYERVKEGSFPRPLKLAVRKAVWVETEIIAWQVEQIEARA